MKKLTTTDFLQKLPINKNYEVVGEYKGTNIPILIKTEFGEHLLTPEHLYKNLSVTIKSAINKTKYFINLINKLYPENHYQIIGEYINMHTSILVKDNFGTYKIRCNHLLEGIKPSIKSAINKNEYCINKLKNLHNNLYSYDKFIFISSQLKSIIICKKHGDFEQTYTNHMQGRGCPKCASNKKSENYSSNTKEFIIKANKMHSNLYDYSKVIYVNARSKIEVECKEHKSFWQTPHRHLLGDGCPICTMKNQGFGRSSFINRSKNKGSTFYIIKCFNENEEFYKIGIANSKVKKRYYGKENMPYSYEILQETKGEAGEIYDLELKNKRLLKDFKYIPKIKFGG